MNIIIDSNILFSALLKDSTTRNLILKYDGNFLIPEYAFTEINKHKRYLQNKSKLSEKEFDVLLNALLRKLKIVSGEKMLLYAHAAIEITKMIDLKDAPFIAACLSYPQSILWSDDKALKKQGSVMVLNTQEIIKLIS